MSLRVRYWIVAIVPLLLAVFLITWLFSTNMWNIYLQERETKLQGVLNLMVKNFEAVAPQQDKDSLITNALKGDMQLQEEARVRLNAALLPYNQALQNAMPTLGLSYSISLLGGPIAEVKNPEAEGKTRIEISAPIYWGGEQIGAARIWETADDLRASFTKTRNTVLGAVGGILLLAVILAFFVIESVNRDIVNLVKQLPSLKESQLPLDTFKGEIGLIASTANELAAELKERTQALNAVMENSPVGLALVKNGEIILTNPIMEKLLPDLESRISADTPDYYHENVKTNDRNISLTFLRVSDEELIAVAEDLTDVINMREAMALQERLAALGRFSAGIAHEIRNPLTAIRGFSQMILKHGSQEDKAYAEKILREQERVEKLVKDMLVYAKPRTAEKKPIKLYEFVAQHFADNPQVKLDIPQNLVWSLDEEYLLQILSNLVGNAFDAGATEVSIEAKKEGSSLILTVANNGPPIPQEDLGKIFEPFYTTKSTGTGLGLAIVRSAAEIQGGSISVKQTEEKTIFEIVFSNGSVTQGNS
ncbi:MAG TPA: acetyltransferase [Coprothermobacter sp.]|nr:acetyltransferase [Coprothermobacter sp.]